MDVIIKLLVKFILKFKWKDYVSGGALTALVQFLANLFGFNLDDIENEDAVPGSAEAGTPTE